MQTIAAIQQHLPIPGIAALASDYICSLNATPENAAVHGHYELVHNCTAQNCTVWNDILQSACAYDYIHIVELAIARGSDRVLVAVRYASMGGHLWLLKSIYAHHPRFQDCGLQDACLSGHDTVIQFAIGSGATNWDAGLQGACEGGHLEIARDMLARGAKNLDGGLQSACRVGMPETARLMISLGADDWSGGLQYACIHDRLEIAVILADAYPSICNHGLYYACDYGSLEIATLMIARGATNIDECLDVAVDPDIHELLRQHI